MADKPKGSRDLVRYEPNERVDLPDMKAMQANGRSEARMLLHNFIFGHGDMGLPTAAFVWEAVRDNATLPMGQTDATTNWSKGGSASPFVILNPTATTIEITPTWFASMFSGQTWGGPLTGAFAGTELENGDPELGAAAGTEGDDQQVLDYNGKPAGDYGIYVTAVFDPGELGTRLFWNAATEQEDVAAMDTRGVAGWNATTNLISGGPPSDAAILVGTVSFDGAAVTAYTSSQNLIFEGLSQSSDGTGPAGTFAQGWGQDLSSGGSLYGHRSNYRFINGVSCWQDWAAALRSQLADIIGDDDGDGVYGWYTQVPRFDGSGGSSGLSGEMCSLMRTRDHIQLSQNPHGSVLTQTDLNVWSDFNVESSLGTLAATAKIRASEVTIEGLESSSTRGVTFDSDTSHGNNDSYYSGNGRIAFYNNAHGEDITNHGRQASFFISPNMWIPGKDYTATVSNAVHTLYRMFDIGNNYWGAGTRGGSAWVHADASNSGNARLHAPLSGLFWSGIAQATGLPSVRITRIDWYLFSNPSWATGLATYPIMIKCSRRQIGAPDSGFDMGTWSNVKFEYLTCGNGGTTGDVNVPPGATPTAPYVRSWDLLSEPDDDWTLGALRDFELQVRLRGDGGSAFSAFFLGAMVTVRLGFLSS